MLPSFSREAGGGPGQQPVGRVPRHGDQIGKHLQGLSGVGIQNRVGDRARAGVRSRPLVLARKGLMGGDPDLVVVVAAKVGELVDARRFAVRQGQQRRRSIRRERVDERKPLGPAPAQIRRGQIGARGNLPVQAEAPIAGARQLQGCIGDGEGGERGRLIRAETANHALPRTGPSL
jgi:hypothetical protein